jgi:hypothetical protein
MSRFLGIRPVNADAGVPREVLLDSLAAFENHIPHSKNFRGELWTYAGMVHNSPLSDVHGLRRHSLVIADDASGESALADVAAMRDQVRALPSGCGVL